MSVRWREWRRREIDVDAVGERLFHGVFGDRVGALVFVGALLFVATYWRVGLFSTDSYTIANTLVAAAERDLAVSRAVYGPVSGDTPGMHIVDGHVYGRNYGQVAASLVALRVMQAVAVVVDLRVAFAAAWSLLLLGGVLSVGRVTGRERLAEVAGPTLALLAFAANLAWARPLSPHWWPVIALQIVTAIAAALTAVLVYRVLADAVGRRVGIAGGVLTVLATPVGFWATIPKRHSLTALFAVTVMYAFYRARAADTPTQETVARAVAYATVAIAAWVHAPEGLVLLFALAAVDLLTADANRPRHLAVIAAAFLLALVPFLVTNTLIAGNPLQPPRMLQSFDGTGPLGGVTESGGTSTAPEQPSFYDGSAAGTGGGDGGPGGVSLGGLVRSVVGTALGLAHTAAVAAGTVAALAPVAADRVGLLADHLTRTTGAWFAPDRLLTVFVRGGYVDGVTPASLAADITEDRAINLTALESMPVLGALAAAPVVAVDWFRTRDPRRLDPWTATVLFVVVYLVLFTTMYLSRLPLHHMFTVRYLHPIYPLGLVLVLGLPPIRRVVRAHARVLTAAAGGTIAVGLPTYVLALSLMDAVQGEAVQLYALTAVTVGSIVAAWTLLATRTGRFDRVGATVLGVAVGVVTVYLLAGGWVVFAYTDNFLFPVGRVVADALRFASPLRSIV